MKQFISNNWFQCSCVVLMSFVIIPLISLGQDSFFTIHDFLDSDLPWFKVLRDSGQAFAVGNDVVIPQYMNGLPRNSMPPSFHGITALVALLGPFSVCILHAVITVIVAWSGMYLLTRDFILRGNEMRASRWVVSTLFAMLPFYGLHTGLASSGIPLLIWSLVHLWDANGRWYHYAAILFFGFYSSLLYTGLFILIPAALLLVYKVIRIRRFPISYFSGLALLSVCFLISEINLVNQFLFSDFQSHRLEFRFEGYGWGATLYRAADLLIHGHYHTPSLQFPVLLGFCAVAGILSVVRFRHLMTSERSAMLGAFSVVVFMVVIALIHGFWGHHTMVALRLKSPILQMIQWNRFHWLLPSLWFILFAFALFHFRQTIKRHHLANALIMFVLAAQVIVTFQGNKPLRVNADRFIAKLSGKPVLKEGSMSFGRFYASNQFTSIRNFIGADPSEYRVVSVGMPADIATYNGFYTLDSYQRNYALAYKHQFRKLIRHELEKSPARKAYFDDWGSRCYVFSAELSSPESSSEKGKRKIDQLSLDLDVFREMGGRYILSAVEISDFGSDRVNLLNVFEDPESYWTIRLYEVI